MLADDLMQVGGDLQKLASALKLTHQAPHADHTGAGKKKKTAKKSGAKKTAKKSPAKKSTKKKTSKK